MYIRLHAVKVKAGEYKQFKGQESDKIACKKYIQKKCSEQKYILVNSL